MKVADVTLSMVVDQANPDGIVSLSWAEVAILPIYFPWFWKTDIPHVPLAIGRRLHIGQTIILKGNVTAAVSRSAGGNYYEIFMPACSLNGQPVGHARLYGHKVM
jgi:hypothetical protein